MAIKPQSYLKMVERGPNTFRATFTSGAQTDSYEAACFFQILTDKGIMPPDIEDYIRIGEMLDGDTDNWKEVRRIAATFSKTNR